MKLFVTALGVALLTSGASVAAPDNGTEPPTASVAQPNATPSQSDRPSEERIGLARRLIALTMPEDGTLQQMRDLSVQLASTNFGDESTTGDREEEAQFTDRLIAKAAPIIRLHMLSIREVTALTYAREFSAAELQQMIAFAATPTGKHYFARVQFVDLDQAIVQQQMMMQDDLRPVYFELRKEMCQERTARRIAAGDKKAKCPLNSGPDTRSS